MKIIFHQLRKDIYRTRWLLLLWLIIVVLRFALVGVNVNPSDTAWQATYQMLGLLTGVIDSLLVFIIVPLVIQQEPLVGTDSFWLTRPLSRGTVFASKALFACVLLVLPLLVEAVVTLANGVTLSDICLALPWLFFSRLSEFLIIAMLAVLTPSFGRFIIGVAIYFILSFVLLFVFQISRIFTDPAAFTNVLPSLTDSQALVSSLVVISLGVVVLFSQYFWRRFRLALALTILAVIVPNLVTPFWKLDFLKPRPPFVVDPHLSATSLSLVLGSNLNTFDQPTLRGGVPEKAFNASIVPVGIPPAAVITISQIKSTLRTDMGTVIPVESIFQNNSFSLTRNIAAIQSALGVQVINTNFSSSEISAQLFSMESGAYTRYREKNLRYEGEVDGTLGKYVNVAELPLKKGAEFRRGSYRLTITNVLHQDDGIDFTAQVQQVTDPFALTTDQDSPSANISAERGSVLYALLNRRLNQAVLEKQYTNYTSGFFAQADEILRHQPLAISFGRENESNNWSVPIDEAWLKDAVLVRLELRPVADFRKTLSVADFRLDGKAMNATRAHLIASLTLAPVVDLEQIQLPAHADRKQVLDYIEAIISASQEQKGWNDSDPEIEMLRQVGPENVDLLIQAGEANHNFYLNRAIGRMVQPDQKNLVVRALAINHDLLDVIIQHHWQQDAKPVLVTALATTNEWFSDRWIETVIDFHDPQTFPVLRDYFVSHPDLATYRSLAKLPGFNLQEAVDLAWKTARQQNRQIGNLLAPAAEIGEPDFPDVATRLLSTGESYSQEQARAAIRGYTPAAGTTDAELLSWMKSNRARLTFDPAAKKFVLAPLVPPQGTPAPPTPPPAPPAK